MCKCLIYGYSFLKLNGRRRLSADGHAAIERQAYWALAIALRQIDEAAKDPNGSRPEFSGFQADIVAALRISPACL